MEIEFIEFNPTKKFKQCVGLLDVFLCDPGLDIRGIHVLKKGERFWFVVPRTYRKDPDTKKEVGFPMISFANQKKEDKFFEEIQKVCLPEIKKILKI